MDRTAVELIQAARPDIVLVAFGNPKQEKWIRMYAPELHVPIAIGIGGTLDMIVGVTKRAPAWMQQSGLEWLYRLAREPKRLFWRYAVTNPLAIFLLLTRTNSLPAEDHAPVMAQVRAAA